MKISYYQEVDGRNVLLDDSDAITSLFVCDAGVVVRLVACWNFCEGTPTEILQTLSLDGIEDLVKDRNRLQSELDEIRECTERAMRILEGGQP